MNKNKRLFLFLSLLIIFFITAPLAVFYSHGYRFDLQNFRIVQTGGFYFIVIPRNAEVTVVPDWNSDLAISRRTSFLFGTTYIENLIPGKYNIEINKEGYHLWQKSLTIEEKKVTEAKNIALLPKDLEFSLINDQVLNIFPLPDQNKIAIKESYNEEQWRILIHNTTTEAVELLLTSEDIDWPKDSPINIFSFPGTERLIINSEQTNIIIDPEEDSRFIVRDIDRPVFHPREDKTIIHLENGSLVSFNYEQKISSILASNIESFAIRQDGSIFWLTRAGYLFQDGEEIENGKFPLIEGNEYEIYFPNLSITAIRENNSFYFLEDDFGFREIFRTVRDPLLSPDRKKLANFSNHEIRVLFLEEQREQPEKKYGDNVFLTRFSGKIGEVNWLTSNHLIFNVDDQIKAIEIDDRDNINISNLAEFNNPQIYFNLLARQLYILSDNNLFVSRRLLP